MEIVNLRLTATGRRKRVALPEIGASGEAALIGRRPVVYGDAAHPVSAGIYERERLAAGATLTGPATVVEYASTTVLLEGDHLTVMPGGELMIRIGGGDGA